MTFDLPMDILSFAKDIPKIFIVSTISKGMLRNLSSTSPIPRLFVLRSLKPDKRANCLRISVTLVVSFWCFKKRIVSSAIC